MSSTYDAVDWARTLLGPRENWPEQLRLMAEFCLDSAFPMQLAWGPDLLVLYNEAYLPLLGESKHPWALGRPARDVWPELWPVSGPIARQVWRTARAHFSRDERIILQRNGRLEEAYFTYAQSPIRDSAGRVVGLFNALSETTRHLLYERRLRVLRQLAAVSVLEAGDLAATCQAVTEVLAGTRESVPFAAIYLPGQQSLHRVSGYGFTPERAPDCGLIRPVVTTGHVWAVFTSHRMSVVDGLRQRHPTTFLPGPLGPLVPDQGVVLPISRAGADEPMAVLVLGVNPYRPVDRGFSTFAGAVAQQLRLLLADAVAYHREREQQLLLAELSAARTEFFENVSHELRTPLTMVLAPLQGLRQSAEDLPESARRAVAVAESAARRLQRVVEALLEHVGAESGTLLPRREQTDLASFTRQIGDECQLLAEQAGRPLAVTVPDEPVRVWVDRTMWSTVLTNLISNALRHTDDTAVALRLVADPTTVTITVEDGGPGIDPSEREQVFRRYHRGSTARGSPGSGIGLALVRDLVVSHGGTIHVTDRPAGGSRFVVTLPG